MQIWSKARNCAEISNADTKNRWGWGLGREETPYLVMSLLSEFLTQANSRGGGGRVLLITAYTAMLLPKGLKGSGIERVAGMSLAVVYERVGKSAIWSD